LVPISGNLSSITLPKPYTRIHTFSAICFLQLLLLLLHCLSSSSSTTDRLLHGLIVVWSQLTV
jgi:hypothetical protein